MSVLNLVQALALVIAAATLGVSTAHSNEKPTSGTTLIEGLTGQALNPIGDEFLIPEGQCSGQITKDQYPCLSSNADSLVTLSVTANRALERPKIVISENFDVVYVYGCGPVYVSLAVACRRRSGDEEPPPPSAPRASRAFRVARESAPRARHILSPVSEQDHGI